MTWRTGVVLVLLVTAGPGLQQFRSSTTILSINVAVEDGRNPAKGLTPADFVVTDNGQVRSVEIVESGSEGIDVTVVRCAATRFVPGRPSLARNIFKSVTAIANALAPADRLRVIDCGTFTKETRPMLPVTTAGPDATMAETTTIGVALFDSLFYAISWPKPADRRHLVIAFTDGFDPATSTVDISRLEALSSRSEAVLHTVLMASPHDSGQNLPRNYQEAWAKSLDAVNDAVKTTGGRVHRAGGEDSLKDAIDSFRSSYLLRITLDDKITAGWHELKVSIRNRPSLKVNARKGYWHQ